MALAAPITIQAMESYWNSS